MHIDSKPLLLSLPGEIFPLNMFIVFATTATTGTTGDGKM
jgi:hypothetical protein